MEDDFLDRFMSLDLDEELTLTEPLGLSFSTCLYCNGYYGPCFDEPLCGTCHDLMFCCEDLEMLQGYVNPSRQSSLYYLPDEKDDEDSGNDEPSEEAGPSNSNRMFLPLEMHPVHNHNVPSPVDDQEDEEEEEEDRRDGLPVSPDEEEGIGIGPGEDRRMVPINGMDEIGRGGRPNPNHNNGEGDADVDFVVIDDLVVGLPVGAVMNGNVAGGLPHPYPPPDSSVKPWPQRPEDKLRDRLAILTIPGPPPPPGPPELNSEEDMSLQVPPEIWAAIFEKLDDVSLAMVSKVSRKWRAIVLDHYPSTKWEEFVRKRWPLFSPVYDVVDWYSVYCDFMDSVPCKLCLINLVMNVPVVNFPVNYLRSVRLQKELKWLKVDHPDGIEATPLDELKYNWLARIAGPSQSPYQGGMFYLNLKVPHDYPLKPPVVRFLTRILHPNVSRHGHIGIDCLQHNWTLALTIPQILLSIQSLLTDPYLDISMEPCVSHLYAKDMMKYEKIAKVWTWKYAMHDVLLH